MTETGRLELPAGTRVVHIGPHKTGTSALQSAFHRNRAALAEHGVHYVGKDRQPVRAVLAVTARQAPLGAEPPRPAAWSRLVEEFRGSEASRLMLSSEFFADGDPDDVRQVMDDLGREHAHVVVTLRPLARLLASQWQQYVRNGMRTGYEDWLQMMFERPAYSMPTPSFWRRHQHDLLVERWADQVGPENVTVVVVDDADPRMIMRTFEELLALPGDALEPETDRRNRSLTFAEIELIRAFNKLFKARDWPPELYHRLIRHGAVRELKRRQAAPGDVPISTPRWALERANEVGTKAAAAIGGSGARIVGDLDALGNAALVSPALDGAGLQPSDLVRSDTAARMLAGAIEGSGLLDLPQSEPSSEPQSEPQTNPSGKRNHPYVHELTSRQLLGIVGQRLRRRLSRLR